MVVFEEWNKRRDELARRVNSIQRKLFNAMFFIEIADDLPRSRTGQTLNNVRELRALDAYTDAAMAELHGALDMLASALSAQHAIVNRRGQPYSFAQMFDQSGCLYSRIANAVDPKAKAKLEALMADARNLIDENNGAKHAGMTDVFLYPSDYPDFLKELSKAVMPELTTGKDVREWLASLRARIDNIGCKICDLVPLLFPVPLLEVSPQVLRPDLSTRGQAHHPVCPKCGKKDHVMRAANLNYRGSATGAGAFVVQPRYWLCDDPSHSQYGWSTP